MEDMGEFLLEDGLDRIGKRHRPGNGRVLPLLVEKELVEPLKVRLLAPALGEMTKWLLNHMGVPPSV